MDGDRDWIWGFVRRRGEGCCWGMGGYGKGGKDEKGDEIERAGKGGNRNLEAGGIDMWRMGSVRKLLESDC